MSKYKIIALIGESGSGKDTLLKEVLKACPGLHKVINYTTRPPREGEVNGENYFFLTKEEFAEKIINMEVFEVTYFRDWFYGTGINSLDESVINIGVFNPDAIGMLLESSEIDLDIYYIKTKPKTRLMRQLSREENPDIEEIIRRYRADNEDFAYLDFYYKELENENQDDLKKSVAYVRNIIRSENP